MITLIYVFGAVILVSIIYDVLVRFGEWWSSRPHTPCCFLCDNEPELLVEQEDGSEVVLCSKCAISIDVDVWHIR